MKSRSSQTKPLYRSSRRWGSRHCDLSRWRRNPAGALERAALFLKSAKKDLTRLAKEPERRDRHLGSAAGLVCVASIFACQAIFLARGGKRVLGEIDVEQAAKLARTKAEREVVKLTRSTLRRLHFDSAWGEEKHAPWLVRQIVQRTERAVDALQGRPPRVPVWKALPASTR